MARGSKGLIRSLVRRAVRSSKSPSVARKGPVFRDPTVCDRCGAVYTRRSWRQGRKLTGALLTRAAWARCPGCLQAGRGEYFGRVIVRGPYAARNLAAIRRRIANVAERAAFTQPERRLVASEWDGEKLEVLTTSQKLAHRIAHELKKLFRGRVSYHWLAEESVLVATWER